MFQKLAAFAAAAGLVATAACTQTDAGITTNVESRLAADETVSAFQVDVDTRDGVVTLTGTVDDPAAKQQAVMIVREIEGVRDVIDRIEIDATAPTSGFDIDADVPDVDVDLPDVDVDIEDPARPDDPQDRR